MTQNELAEKIKSSQPRIAKAENGDASVSIELLIRASVGLWCNCSRNWTGNR